MDNYRKWKMSASKSMILLMVMLLCGVSSHVVAQGKTGTTITLDGTNCTILYSEGASKPNQEYFTYLRHNQLPIQILNSNYYPLADNNTGFFKTLANNMGTTDGCIDFYNWASNCSELYFAVIAPQGYNIARYVMDVNSSIVRSEGNTSGAVIEELTYTQNNSEGTAVTTGNSLTLNGSQSQVLDATKTGVQKLYFRIRFLNTNAYQVRLNSFKLTFTIDDPFEVAVPNSTGGEEVHTGLVDLGQFKSNGANWTFTSGNVTDLQNVNLFGEDEDENEIETHSTKVDGESYFWTLKNGTFYVEAPKIYRIVGATLNFLSRETPGTEATPTYASTGTLSVTSGNKYVIGYSGHYLQLKNNGTSYSYANVSDVTQATVWTVTTGIVSNQTVYYIYSEEDGRYFCLNSSNLSSSTSPSAWYYYTNYGIYQKTGSGSQTTSYYLRYARNKFSASTDTSNSIKAPFYEVTPGQPAVTYAAGTYTATVYGADGEQVAATCGLSPENAEATATVTGLNNDAVKFKIEGLGENQSALFRVALTILPLDPYVQTIETAYYEDSKVISSVSTSSQNLFFNNGETIVVPVPGAMKKGDNDTYQIVFRNAYNENRSADYTGEASGNGLSNYYLIDSEYETTGAGNHMDADRAGTSEQEFTNIKQVKAGTQAYLKDNDFDKGNAAYEEIRLKNEESKTVYIYSADKPAYNIMPEDRRLYEHIAYSFYKATVMPLVVEEVPDIEVADVSDIVVYSSTLKGANGKNSSIGRDTKTDTQHYFFGITVKAKKEDPENTSAVRGVLTSDQIIQAVENLLKTSFYDRLYSADDPFRTILYLDMSYLTTVSDADGLWADFRMKTADNCLYFMPSNYNSNSTNVIAGGVNGDGEAVGDIIIRDQQPFYTPYTFKTGTHIVHYERTGTNGKEPTQNTTLVMPFDIPLSSEGYLKTYSNQVNEDVRFYTMTSLDGEDTEAHVDTKAWTFTATPVTTGVATANTPYHIKSAKPTETSSFVVELTGATFRPTNVPTAMTAGGALQGYGNYNGVEVDKSENILYFSKDYFWNSSTLTTSNTVKILPFRAYYTTSRSLNGASKLSVKFDDQDFTLGDANGDGTVTVTDVVHVVNNITGADTKGLVFGRADMDGNGQLNITDVMRIVNIILDNKE